MTLAHLTWPEVRALPRDVVVLVPTGSIEQHGPHLPLVTDTLLVTEVAQRAEAAVPQSVLLTPTLWLGASAHHMSFEGTLSASHEGYDLALTAVLESMAAHGFWRFLVLNGPGGNTSGNDIACRRFKEGFPEATVARVDYFAFVPQALLDSTLRGSTKGIRHACEAETSMMMHVAPGLVREDRLRDDGLSPDGGVMGLVLGFDEQTEEGSFGQATLASAEAGHVLLEAAVAGLTAQLLAMHEGVSLGTV